MHENGTRHSVVAVFANHYAGIQGTNITHQATECKDFAPLFRVGLTLRLGIRLCNNDKKRQLKVTEAQPVLAVCHAVEEQMPVRLYIRVHECMHAVHANLPARDARNADSRHAKIQICS
jgi:hypothetical protein